MAKKIIALKPNQLLTVAAGRGASSISALHEATGIDRKTLTTLNQGRSVKTSTLKKIADSLRIPPSHFEADPSLGSTDDLADSHNLELKLIDGKSLKSILEQLANPKHISWNVSLDRISPTLQSKLLNFERLLRNSVELFRGLGEWQEKHRSLEAQLARVSVSDQLDALMQEIRPEGVKLFGGSWRKWEKEEFEHHHPDIRSWWSYEYRSFTHALISIEQKSRTGLPVEVDIGEVPPRFFAPSDEVSQITVDGKIAYDRRRRTMKEILDEDIPF
jgi:DNA-binding Xre family transcriptional regulator